MNFMKTTLLLGALTGILMLFGSMLGGQNGMLMGLVMAAVMNLGSYWFSDKIVLAMYRAKQLGPEDGSVLYRVVRQLADRNQMPMPKVFIIPEQAPNAFATGRNPAHASVAATEGILRILDEKELEGVMAHEMAHVRNRDILISSIAATLAGAITYVAHMAQWAAMFGGGRSRDDNEGGSGIFGMIFMAILAPIAAMLIQMAISRSREYVADATGARMCGKPLRLASALEKLEQGSRMIPMEAGAPSTAHLFIVNPFKGGFATLFSTHPPMAERIKRLEELAREMG